MHPVEQKESPDSIKCGLNLLKLPPECWRPFEGEGLRKSDRLGEREIEQLTAALRIQSMDTWWPVKLRDMSLHGFGVHCNYSTGNGSVPTPGAKADLRIEGPWGQEIILQCEVKNCQFLGEGLRIGLERCDLHHEPEHDSSRPGKTTQLEAGLRLTVRMANPILYNEWGEAVLTGFSPDGEWVFESEDNSSFLFPGIPARVIFDLPMESHGESLGTIRWVATRGPGRVAFGLVWNRLSFQVSNAVGEHLLRSSEWKPRDLLGHGIHLKRFKEDLRFSFVSTLEEYAQVLDLRREAYVEAGKRPPETTPSQLASRHDGQSRILAAYHGDTLVATVSLTFAQGPESRLRSEGEFPDGRYPIPMPQRDRIMEIHSLCTRREYRGGDLMRGVVEHMARCLILSDRDWAVTFATDEMWKLYRKIGFRKTGAKVPIKALNGIVHHLILLHRSSPVCGRRMSMSSWNYFFATLAADLSEKGFLRFSAWEKLLFRSQRWFGGFVRKRSDRRLENEFQSFLERFAAKGGADAAKTV